MSSMLEAMQIMGSNSSIMMLYRTSTIDLFEDSDYA